MRKIGGVVYMDWRVMIQDGAEENKVRFSSIQFDSVRFSSIQFDSVRFSSIQFDSVRFSSIQCIYLKDGSCL